MNSAARVLLNTIVLYAKILISMAISLVSVPLVLRALGASDYGLYNLVAGVVAMLSFLNSSLTVSSQRYMSVAMGTNDTYRINIVYNTSFWLHLVLGIIVVLLLECGAPFIGKLNIDPSRMQVAQLIYQLLILSTFVRILSVPYDAIMNAHEDMVPFAIIEIIDSFLLLLTALLLRFIQFDKLAFYGISICLIAVVTILMKSFWCAYKYKNYRISILKKRKELITKELTSFAGWNLFGGLALIGRNQGVAIIINLFLGTVINAAYGIANQINGALSQFSVTFQKAINPQLMKSEGMNNRGRLLRLSFISSKYSVLALGFFTIPLIIEMPDVLILWLGREIPPYTVELSRCILILTLIYQFTVGIGSAIQAAGNIRNYQIVIGCIVLLNIPLSHALVYNGYPVFYTTIGFVLLEIVSIIIRLWFAKKLVGMMPSEYVKMVLIPTIVVIVLSACSSLVPHLMIHNIWLRLLITCIVFGVVFSFSTWMFGFDGSQRDEILSSIKTRFSFGRTIE